MNEKNRPITGHNKRRKQMKLGIALSLCVFGIGLLICLHDFYVLGSDDSQERFIGLGLIGLTFVMLAGLLLWDITGFISDWRTKKRDTGSVIMAVPVMISLLLASGETENVAMNLIAFGVAIAFAGIGWLINRWPIASDQQKVAEEPQQ